MGHAPSRRPFLAVFVVIGLSFLSPGQSPNDIQTRQPVHESTPQSTSIPSKQDDLSLNWNDFDHRVWVNAKTYVDMPLQDVVDTVPELKSMTQGETPKDSASLLHKVGKTCMELLQHTPSVASREDQITTQRTVSRISQGVLVPAALPPTREKQTFGYLLMSQVTDAGVELREYRTDKKGRPVSYSGSKSGQVSEGFASEWLRLFPANQNQSRFRFLGYQNMDDHKTLVIAFAEVPDHVKFPTMFSFDGTRLALLFQGIAWIDASDFRIVRLKENLLAPRPDLHLTEMSISVRLGDVHILKAQSTLWLPLEVDVAWKYKGVAVEQQHLYSDFRLYAVHSKIVPQ
jgi:hypothetical protein